MGVHYMCCEFVLQEVGVAPCVYSGMCWEVTFALEKIREDVIMSQNP